MVKQHDLTADQRLDELAELLARGAQRWMLRQQRLPSAPQGTAPPAPAASRTTERSHAGSSAL